MVDTMYLPHLDREWRKAFAATHLDVIPDPMVMRIADLFIGGKSFAINSRLDPDKVWKVIEENLDSLLAFFHILMTRDRIPLIDYEYTFSITNFCALGDIALTLHPPNYRDLKERAKLKLSTIDLNRIPAERREQLAAQRKGELEAIGYEWFPNPGEQFIGGDRLLATHLLGGLIFGGYAQISGSDHVLQDARNQLLLELTQPEEEALWGAQQEAKLFSRLNATIARDPRLSSSDVQLPPTVLPFLLSQHPASPRHLLDNALALREMDSDFVAYRRWHHEIRSAWANGTHDDKREKDVVTVTKELTKRYPLGKDPFDTPAVWSREIGIKAILGAETGVNTGIEHGIDEGEKLTAGAKANAKAEIEFDLGKVRASFPDWIRNWLIEGIQFRSHRKVLLRLSLAQRHYDNLLLGLKRLWTS
jgi:hypothetical protein